MSQQINLFNPAFEPQKMLFSALAMAQVLGVVLLAVTALAVYGKLRVDGLEQQAQAGARALQKKQERLARVSTEFAPRQPSSALADELTAAQAQLSTLRQVAGVLDRGELGNTQGYSEYFKALARQNVDGLWLTAVTIGGAGSEIGVRGRALDPALLPGYLNRLTREKSMQGKAFGSLHISAGAPVKTTGKDGKESSQDAPYVEFSLQSGADGAPS
jgi:Tfp pilus assembly protein PilN